MKILYVGETWMGSSARSLRDGLSMIKGVVIDDIGEDQYVPIQRTLPLRILNRFSRPLQRAALREEIHSRIKVFLPDILMVYKGNGVDPEAIVEAKKRGIFTVNVFPDCSPHAHGKLVKKALGLYDLVISAKPFHPDNWNKLYGYQNKCTCVPHGYDPLVHFWGEPPLQQDLDVVMAASWRPQYEKVMLEFAERTAGTNISVGLAGPGWGARREVFPKEWEISGRLYGRSYGEWVRRGRIVIAPVHREIFIGGQQQPGDEDTTRTYELAAAYCFFLHRRTPFAVTVYDEATEVPMWDSAEELAALVKKFLPLEGVRRSMAQAAHRRAVPAYSVPARAVQVATEVRAALASR
jgi:glycosyltransferase involved in cell wall biosynthesis